MVRGEAEASADRPRSGAAAAAAAMGVSTNVIREPNPQAPIRIPHPKAQRLSPATARATGPYSPGRPPPLEWPLPFPLPLPFPFPLAVGCRAIDRMDMPLIERSKSAAWARLNTTPASL